MAPVVVEVVREDGSPVPGAEVAVRASGVALPRRVDSRTTGADGRARVERLMLGIPETANRLTAAVLGPEKELAHAEFVRTPLPTEAIRLVVPPVGSIEVLVLDADGSPLPDTEARVWLLPKAAADAAGHSWHASADPRASNEMPCDQHGRALFPLVPLRREWAVGAVWEGGGEIGVVQRCTGPSRDGERVRVQLEATPVSPVVVARLLSPQGKPLSAAKVKLAIEGLLWSDTEATILADEEGRVRCGVPLQDGGPTEAGWTLRFSVDQPGGPPLGASLNLTQPLLVGENDLGDIHLELAPLLAGGMVLDTDGEAVGGAYVRLHRDWVGESGRAGSGSLGTPVRTDREGRFAAYGFEARGAASSRYRLRVSHPKYNDLEQPFDLGEDGLRIILGAGASLSGAVLLDEEVPLHKLSARLMVDPIDDERTTGYHHGIDDAGGFSWNGVAAGTGKLAIVVDGLRRPVAEVEGIVLRPGVRTEDPRLNPVDLRGRLFAVTVTVRDSEGEAILGAGVRVLEGEGRASMYGPPGPVVGEFTVLSTAASFDIEVSAPGFRSQVIRDVAADYDVVLVPGIEAEIELARLPPLPDGCRFRVHLRADDGGRGGVMTLYPGPEGRATTKLPRAGRWRVNLFVERAENGRTRIRSVRGGVAELSVRPGVPSVRVAVPVPADGLESALP